MTKKSIFDIQALEEFRKEHQLDPYRIDQIYQAIFKHSILDFEQITTLPKQIRDALKERFFILSIKPLKVLESEDTTKIAFETQDGHLIETVIMYHYHKKDKSKKLNRITLCLSSQIWCPVWCVFCVTGKLGLTRNLSYEEMISQALFANNLIKNKLGKKSDGSWYKIRNVVFMGMWEPFLNWENVKKTILTFLDQKRWFSLSRRHITISTSGIVQGIQRMLKDNINVMLAVSLHSPEQNLREKLIPFAQIYKLQDLMKVLDEYSSKTGNRIFYEYIMIRDITDKKELAYQLVDLLKNKNAHINLIPYNENPAIDLQESRREDILAFKRILEKGGLTVTIRDSLGREVKWACGQLGYEKVQSKI